MPRHTERSEVSIVKNIPSPLGEGKGEGLI